MLKRLTTEEFKQRADIIHNGKYTYLKSEYKNAYTEVCITCPIHGDFYQTPHSHLRGRGCKKCGIEKSRQSKFYNTEEFIGKAKEIHGDKYDYSLVDYKGCGVGVLIICPKHGVFLQKPLKHLQNCGCQKCGKENRAKLKTKTTQEFIQRAMGIYGELYDYSQVNYVKAKQKVDVVCRKHGVFQVSPDNHLRGKGCPKCKSSHVEMDIRNLLIENNIKFEEQKRFEWLGLQSLDFYIPSKNIAIECQGEQHFSEKKLFGGADGLARIQKRDKIKKEKCNKHQITILYYADYKLKFPYMVYTEKTELINEINKVNNGTTDTKED